MGMFEKQDSLSDGHQRRRDPVRQLKHVEKFINLGSMFAEEGGYKMYVKNKCLKAENAFYQLPPNLGHT